EVLNMIKIAPSILSANFAELGAEINEVERAGADYIHVDVMDGNFVPNITTGPLVVEAIKPTTNLPLDVHLMIENPDQYIEAFAKAGASIIPVHQEASVHLHRTIHLIKRFGVNAGGAINPATPAAMMEPVLPYIDLALVMTVNPGFGGQSFIPETISKIKTLDEWRKRHDYAYEIEVDGGINVETAKICVENGADVLVAGSAIFNKPDREKALKAIRKSAVG